MLVHGVEKHRQAHAEQQKHTRKLQKLVHCTCFCSTARHCFGIAVLVMSCSRSLLVLLQHLHAAVELLRESTLQHVAAAVAFARRWPLVHLKFGHCSFSLVHLWSEHLSLGHLGSGHLPRSHLLSGLQSAKQQEFSQLARHWSRSQQLRSSQLRSSQSSRCQKKVGDSSLVAGVTGKHRGRLARSQFASAVESFGFELSSDCRTATVFSISSSGRGVRDLRNE